MEQGTTYKHFLGHEDLTWLYITGPAFAEVKRKSRNWEILVWAIAILIVPIGVYGLISDSTPTWISFVQMAIIVALVFSRAMQKATPRELRKKAKQVRCPQIRELASKENVPFQDVADAIRRSMGQDNQTVRLNEHRLLTYDPHDTQASPPGRKTITVAPGNES